MLAQSAAPVASSLPTVSRQQVATPVELVVRDVPAPKPFPVERKPEQQRLPFVGREAVYGHLIGLVDVIQGGRGQVALVEGEPGVGKSRLVAEVLDQFDQREICLLRTKCYEVEQEIPFGVVVDLVSQALATYRPVEAATHATLPATLVTWRQEPYVDYLQLPRLSAEAVGGLVSLVLPSHAPVVDLAAWLHDETDGNAFFIACLLQLLQEQAAQVGEIPQVGELLQSGPHVAPNLTLPHALRRTVRQWLGDVPVHYHAVFQMIAAFGRRIDFATLQQLTDTPESELLQILEGLLARHDLDEVENGRYYDFNHDKIREVVYYDLSQTRRRPKTLPGRSVPARCVTQRAGTVISSYFGSERTA